MCSLFFKRGGLLNNVSWSYKGDNIEVVNDFNSLGTVFNYTGTFALNQETLVGKGLKALNILLYNTKKYCLKPKVMCQLFDAFVGSVLSFSSEIWGLGKSKEVERIHPKVLQNITQGQVFNLQHGCLWRARTLSIIRLKIRTYFKILVWDKRIG